MVNQLHTDGLNSLHSMLKDNPQALADVIQKAEQLSFSLPKDSWLMAEIGGLFDPNGYEQEACKWYEQALACGEDTFPPEQIPHFFVWYGSTLRNVKRFAESENILRTALAKYPNFSALQFFLALTLMSQGRTYEAMLSLAELHTGKWDESIKSYNGAVESYLHEELRSAVNKLSANVTRLCVENVEKSVAWYAQVLNVSPCIVIENFALLRWNGGALEFAKADEKNPLTKGGSVTYWNANPFTEWIEKFKKHGATLYRGPLFIAEEGVSICQFQDPFGNIIGLTGVGVKDE